MMFYMFNRPHRQRIAKMLTVLNSDLLRQAKCILFKCQGNKIFYAKYVLEQKE